jgi:hypothetical protein
MMQGTRNLAVSAVREVDVLVWGTRISYKNLSEADQKAVDEIVKYVARFADDYGQHHAKYKQEREKYDSFEDYLESHADEIVSAAIRTAMAHTRSSVYDAAVGKPKFMDEMFAKEFVNEYINKCCDKVG